MNNLDKSKQRFSIRKYHFGAASVLLGMFFATSGASAQTENSTHNVPKEQQTNIKSESLKISEHNKEVLNTPVVTKGASTLPTQEVTPIIQTPNTVQLNNAVLPKMGEAKSVVSSVSQGDVNLVNVSNQEEVPTLQDSKVESTNNIVAPKVGEAKPVASSVSQGDVNLVNVSNQEEAPTLQDSKVESTNNVVAPKVGEAKPVASSVTQEDVDRINALPFSEEEKAELLALLESGEVTIDDLLGGAEEETAPPATEEETNKAIIEEEYVEVKAAVNKPVVKTDTHLNKLKSLEEATIYFDIKPWEQLTGRFDIYNATGNNGQDYFSIFSNEGIIQAELYDSRVGHRYNFSSSATIEPGKWNNIAFVHTNTDNKLYVNGKLAYISPTTSPIKDSKYFVKDITGVDTVNFGPRLFLQQTRNGGADFKVKEFKVFGKALTAEELTDLSKFTIPEKSPNDTEFIAKSSLYGTHAQTGYYGYRVPYTLKTKDGTLLTSASRHINHHIDWGDLNIGLTRSEDNGKTWSPVKEIVDLAENPASKGIASSAFTIDTAMVQDSKTGKIILLTDVFRESQGLFDRVKDHRPQYTGTYLNLYQDDTSTEAYTVRENGVVYNPQGEKTDYTVVTPDLSKVPKNSDIGNIIKDGKVVGNYLFTNNTPFRVVNRVYTWQLESTDDGKTWSNPKDITKDLLGQGISDVLISPTSGIQTESGRLIVPVYYTDKSNRAGRFIAGNLYSDDNGLTWQTSRVSDKFGVNTSENSIVDLGNNNLMMVARSDGGKTLLFYKSNDGGKTWNLEPQKFNEIPTLRVQPSIVTTSYKGKDYVVLSSALGPMKTNGALFLLEVKEDGKLEFVKSKVFERSNFSYSSLTKLDDSNFMVTYENSPTGYNMYGIAKKHLSMDWLFKEDEVVLNQVVSVNKLEGNQYEFVYKYPVTTVVNPSITVGGSQGTFVKQSDTKKLVFEINDIREISPQVTHTGIESVDSHKILDGRVKFYTEDEFNRIRLDLANANLDKEAFAGTKYWFAFGDKDISDRTQASTGYRDSIEIDKTHIQHIEQFVRYHLQHKDEAEGLISRDTAFRDNTAESTKNIFGNLDLSQSWSTFGKEKEAVVITSPSKSPENHDEYINELVNNISTLVKYGANVVYIENPNSPEELKSILNKKLLEIKDSETLYQKKLAVILSQEFSSENKDFDAAQKTINTIFSNKALQNKDKSIVNHRDDATFEEEVSNYAIETYKLNNVEQLRDKSRLYDILALGDSITHSAFWSQGGKNTTEYLDEILERVDIKNGRATGIFDSSVVQNMAASGTKAKDIEEYYDKSITTTSILKDASEVIYIAYGTNDTKENISAEEIVKRITEGVAYVRSKRPNARILVSDVTPRPQAKDTRIEQINELLYDEEKTETFEVVRNYDRIKGAIEKFGAFRIIPDGLHLSEYSSMIIAHNIYAHLLKSKTNKGTSLVEQEKPSIVIETRKGESVQESEKSTIEIKTSKGEAAQLEEKPSIVIKSQKGESAQTEEKPSIVIETRKGDSVQELEKELAKIPVGKGTSLVEQEKPSIVIETRKGESVQESEKSTIEIKTSKGEAAQLEEKPSIVIETRKGESVQESEKSTIEIKTSKGEGVRLEASPEIAIPTRKGDVVVQDINLSQGITKNIESNIQVASSDRVKQEGKGTRREQVILTSKESNVKIPQVTKSTTKGVLPKTSVSEVPNSMLPAGLAAALLAAGLLSVKRRKEN